MDSDNLKRFNLNRSKVCHTELAVQVCTEYFDMGAIRLKCGTYEFDCQTEDIHANGTVRVCVLHGFKILSRFDFKNNAHSELVMYDDKTNTIKFSIPSMVGGMPLTRLGSMIPEIVTKVSVKYLLDSVVVDCSDCRFENLVDAENLFEGIGHGGSVSQLVLPRGKYKLAPVTAYHMFASTDIPNINSLINDRDVLDFSQVEIASEMFMSIQNSSLDLSGVEFKKANHADYMFFGSNLQEIYFGENTLKCVADAGMMFCKCDSLKKIKLNCFGKNKLSKYREMFSGCTSLESVEANWNYILGSADASGMFKGCRNLRQLDVMGFINAVTQRVELVFLHNMEIAVSILSNISDAFVECYKLEWCSAYTPTELIGRKSLSLDEQLIALIDTDILNISGIVHKGNKSEPINYAVYKLNRAGFPNILITDEKQYNYEKCAYQSILDRKGYSVCFVEHEYIDFTVKKLKAFGGLGDFHTIIVSKG